MPYHLAILHMAWVRGGSEERAVQGRGDIASKQKGSPFRTDYNKLTTLIERKGKLSALFACNAMPIKVGERFWLAVYYTKFSELLKLSREYQMLTVTKVTGPMRPVTGNLLVPGKLRSLCKNPRLKKKTPESAQGKIRKQENCTNLPPVTLSGLRRRRKKVWVQFLMKRSYSHSMDMLAFGMKMDEQALEPGTDEIRGKHGTVFLTIQNSGAFDQDVLASPVWALARIGTFMGRLSTQSNSLPIGRQYNKRESLRMGPLSDAEPMREGESIWEKGGLRAFKNQWKGKTCSLHSFLSKESH
ncbi:hypothetical protein Tco_0993487 [Tanacetum coccineum]